MTERGLVLRITSGIMLLLGIGKGDHTDDKSEKLIFEYLLRIS